MNRALVCVLTLPLLAHAACSLETPVDPATGGSSSTAGAGVQGGTATTGGGGSGSTTAGSAGVSTSGGMAGTPGVSGSGTGGATGGSGGSSAGTAGTGTGGSGGAGGGGNEPTLAEVVGKLDGRLVTMKCLDMPGSDDCNSAGAVSEGVSKACSGSKLDVQYDHPIGGTPGQMYEASMHFYGIMEPKNYGAGVTREAGWVAANRDGGLPLP